MTRNRRRISRHETRCGTVSRPSHRADRRSPALLNRRESLRRIVLAGAGSVLQTGSGAPAAEPVVPTATKPAAQGGVLVERWPRGGELWQVTTERFNHSNIYTEISYATPDSKHFVYERARPERKDNPTEFVAVEIGSWRERPIAAAVSLEGCTMTRDGWFYYVHSSQGSQGGRGGEVELRRVRPAGGPSETLYRRKPGPWIETLGTVSPDGRTYAGMMRLDEQWKQFGIFLLDIPSGRETIIDRDPFIFNAHSQFEPGQGMWLLIQHNRGGGYEPDGKLRGLVGPEGATLYLLSVPDGRRVTLQVGSPFTTHCTGHETWIGTTEEVLLSVEPGRDYSIEKGTLLGVRAGQPPRVVARGYAFNHVGISNCGRYFIADDWQGQCKIVVGSVRTGRTAVLCESKASMRGPQNTHPHAYLTPDLKWAIFNSDRSGFPHIYAAQLPEGMIESLG